MSPLSPLVVSVFCLSLLVALCSRAVAPAAASSCSVYADAAYNSGLVAANFTSTLDDGVDIYPIVIPAVLDTVVLRSISLVLAPNVGQSANLRFGVFDASGTLLSQSDVVAYAGSSSVQELTVPLQAPYLVPASSTPLTVYVGSSSDNEYISVFTSTVSNEAYASAQSYPPAAPFPGSIAFTFDRWPTVPYALTVCPAPPRQSSCNAFLQCEATPAVVPLAVYNATFTAQRLSHYGDPSQTWTWQADDTAVYAPCHRGLASFNAATQQYVDLTAPNGPSTAGTALPAVLIGGDGSGSVADGTAGWSFELTFRDAQAPPQGAARILALGPTEDATENSIWIETAGDDSGLAVVVTDANGDSDSVEFQNPADANWHHIVVVLQQLQSPATTNNDSSVHGAWFVWLDGQLVNYTALGGVSLTSLLPGPVARPFAVLAEASYPPSYSWESPSYTYWSGLIDTFRMYDRALTGAQVQTLFLGEMGACAVAVQPQPKVRSSRPNVLSRSSPQSPPAPFYSQTFDKDPRLLTHATGYGWEPFSPFDSPQQQRQRRGLLTLNGDAQFVDLAATSGPNAISTSDALGVIGGGRSSGWSFEATLKPWDTQWAKLIDIGATRNTTACNGDIVLGWEDSNPAWQFEYCDGNGLMYQTPNGFGPIASLGWYHMVVVIAASGEGMADYLTFIDGELYAALANVPYPPAVERQNSWLGRSGWGDPYLQVELDTFRIYDSALSAGQVATLFKREFPTGVSTPPAGQDDVVLADDIGCAGFGTLTEQDYFACNEWADCYSPSSNLITVAVQAPAGFTVSHIGLFNLVNTSSSGLGDNSGLWTFRFGLYFLNNSNDTLQLLAQTDAMNVTGPGISSSYVVMALEHHAKYRLPAALISDLYIGLWFTGSNSRLSVLQAEGGAYGVPGIDATHSMPTGLAAGSGAWADAMDLLYCDSTDSLILQSMP